MQGLSIRVFLLAHSKREEAAEQVLDGWALHFGVDQQDYVSHYVSSILQFFPLVVCYDRRSSYCVAEIKEQKTKSPLHFTFEIIRTKFSGDLCSNWHLKLLLELGTTFMFSLLLSSDTLNVNVNKAHFQNLKILSHLLIIKAWICFILLIRVNFSLQ